MIKKKTKCVCECGYEFCGNCYEKWHEKTSCKKASGKFKSYLNKKYSRTCPHCKVRIEKSEGCHTMTCSNCHKQFCWACGKPGAYHKTCMFALTSQKNLCILSLFCILSPFLTFCLFPLILTALCIEMSRIRWSMKFKAGAIICPIFLLITCIFYPFLLFIYHLIIVLILLQSCAYKFWWFD